MNFLRKALVTAVLGLFFVVTVEAARIKIIRVVNDGDALNAKITHSGNIDENLGRGTKEFRERAINLSTVEPITIFYRIARGRDFIYTIRIDETGGIFAACGVIEGEVVIEGGFVENGEYELNVSMPYVPRLRRI